MGMLQYRASFKDLPAKRKRIVRFRKGPESVFKALNPLVGDPLLIFISDEKSFF